MGRIGTVEETRKDCGGFAILWSNDRQRGICGNLNSHDPADVFPKTRDPGFRRDCGVERLSRSCSRSRKTALRLLRGLDTLLLAPNLSRARSRHLSSAATPPSRSTTARRSASSSSISRLRATRAFQRSTRSIRISSASIHPAMIPSRTNPASPTISSTTRNPIPSSRAMRASKDSAGRGSRR